MKLPNSRTCIVIKDSKELKVAMQIDVCRHIIKEEGNSIYIWNRFRGKWTKNKYTIYGDNKEKDDETTGLKAYQAFYSYCGKSEIDRMKTILRPIEIWESYEQMHYCNWEHADKKIYKPIFIFDANSAFTYGVFELPDGFVPLKEYMGELYDKKDNAPTKMLRSRYKNLQVYLIGYFARIKGFISTRSEVIRKSNENIKLRIAEIVNKKGTVYLSNTDSIVTDEIGAEIMQKYIGHNAGQFKLEQNAERLFYKSSNCYQIGDKVTYSGVKYFARQNVDFFKDLSAEQYGSLVEAFDFEIGSSDNCYNKICRVRAGVIRVEVKNLIGELVEEKEYKIEV